MDDLLSHKHLKVRRRGKRFDGESKYGFWGGKTTKRAIYSYGHLYGPTPAGLDDIDLEARTVPLEYESKTTMDAFNVNNSSAGVTELDLLFDLPANFKAGTMSKKGRFEMLHKACRAACVGEVKKKCGRKDFSAIPQVEHTVYNLPIIASRVPTGQSSVYPTSNQGAYKKVVGTKGHGRRVCSDPSLAAGSGPGNDNSMTIWGIMKDTDYNDHIAYNARCAQNLQRRNLWTSIGIQRPTYEQYAAWALQLRPFIKSVKEGAGLKKEKQVSKEKDSENGNEMGNGESKGEWLCGGKAIISAGRGGEVARKGHWNRPGRPLVDVNDHRAYFDGDASSHSKVTTSNDMKNKNKTSVGGYVDIDLGSTCRVDRVSTQGQFPPIKHVHSWLNKLSSSSSDRKQGGGGINHVNVAHEYTYPVITASDYHSEECNNWVTQYKLHARAERGAWMYVGTFKGNEDMCTERIQPLTAPIECRYLRFTPTSCHKKPRMRLGAYGERKSEKNNAGTIRHSNGNRRLRTASYPQKNGREDDIITGTPQLPRIQYTVREMRTSAKCTNKHEKTGDVEMMDMRKTASSMSRHFTLPKLASSCSITPRTRKRRGRRNDGKCQKRMLMKKFLSHRVGEWKEDEEERYWGDDMMMCMGACTSYNIGDGEATELDAHHPLECHLQISRKCNLFDYLRDSFESDDESRKDKHEDGEEQGSEMIVSCDKDQWNEVTSDVEEEHEDKDEGEDEEEPEMIVLCDDKNQRNEVTSDVEEEHEHQDEHEHEEEPGSAMVVLCDKDQWNEVTSDEPCKDMHVHEHEEEDKVEGEQCAEMTVLSCDDGPTDQWIDVTVDVGLESEEHELRTVYSSDTLASEGGRDDDEDEGHEAWSWECVPRTEKWVMI